MATQPGNFPWRTPWTEDPSGLQAIELQRVGRDKVTQHACIHIKTFKVKLKKKK